MAYVALACSLDEQRCLKNGSLIRVRTNPNAPKWLQVETARVIRTRIVRMKDRSTVQRVKVRTSRGVHWWDVRVEP